MELPDNSIGITDLLAYRECARRMSYGMRRHTGRAAQSDQEMPEANIAGAVWARSYGSAIHTAIEAIEDGDSDDDAIQQTWNRYGRYLDPEDLDLLRDDLRIYRARDFAGTRTIAAEDEYRVPLFVHNGVQIYFRFKLDRLYERLDSPGDFLHIDYKSSKWAKSDAEVHSDLQLWSYNFGIHEFFPECERLHQFYDQLRYGQIPTRKTDKQREQIREWLIRQATAVLEDEAWQEDGLLEHSLNEWCPWCPILEGCPVVPKLTDFSLARIAALQPMRAKLKKDGTESKVQEATPLDPSRIDEYAEQLPDVMRAKAVLERFESSVKAIVRDMPSERRAALGYELRGRKNRVFDAGAAQALHERLGPRFYELVKLTKSGLESNLAEDESLLEWALELAEEQAGAVSVVKARSP